MLSAKQKHTRFSVLARTTLFLLIGALLFIFEVQAVTACPGCNTIETGSVGRGFNLSVLFMMAMPFIVAGSVVVGLILMQRKK